MQEHEVFFTILREIESKANVRGFIAEQVNNELATTTESVRRESTEALDKFRSKVEKVYKLATLYGLKTDLDTNNLKGYDDRRRKVMDRWLKVCTVVHQSDAVVSRAFARVNQARTPARRGKASMMDCVILETYIECLRELRGNGLTSPAVFVSSNKKDYSTTSGVTIRDDAKSEFDLVGLAYAPNMAAEKHFLGI